MSLFTLESEIEGYETYYCLEWCGTSFRQAIEERDRLMNKYVVYDKDTIFKITVWINGCMNQEFFYKGREEFKVR
jgi:hypothetical protein